MARDAASRAEQQVQLRRRQDDRRRRRCGKAEDLGRLAGHIEDHLTGSVEDGDLTAEHGDGHLGADLDGDAEFGAPDADGARRCLDGDVRGVGLSDFPGDDDEQPLDEGKYRGALMGRRVVDQFIEHHARVFGEGEGGLVDEDEPERGFRAGFYDIAGEYGGAPGEGHYRPIGARRRRLARNRLHIADRGPRDGRRGLDVLARRQGTG